MTDNIEITYEQKKVKIAKALPQVFKLHKYVSGDEVYFNSNGVFILWTIDNDLNALHQAEKFCVKNIDYKIEYLKKLREVCCQKWPANNDAEFATAEQRIEALGQTLKLW